MEQYLGAKENADALTFKNAASHSRQNHATVLPLCTARKLRCPQSPSILPSAEITDAKHTCTVHPMSNPQIYLNNESLHPEIQELLLHSVRLCPRGLCCSVYAYYVNKWLRGSRVMISLNYGIKEINPDETDSRGGRALMRM